MTIIGHMYFLKKIEGEQSEDPQPQFENDHPLPAIEVSTLDEYGKTANTYIYTYYFDEVECTPDNFYATFTGSDGYLVGDNKHPFYFPVSSGLVSDYKR